MSADKLPLYAELQTLENGVLTNDVKVFVSGEPRLYFTVNNGTELTIGTTNVSREFNLHPPPPPP